MKIIDLATMRRRLRRLREPGGVARVLHTLRYQRYLNRQIRTYIDGHHEGAAVPQRPPRSFPSSPDDLRKARFLTMWWYYEAELLPGLFAKGIYPRDLPMLPRIMLRRCDPAGMSFLDIGAMEGLMSVLMKRRGAGRVLAVDAIDGCTEKMEALKHYYRVDFDFKVVGLMYDLYRKLGGEGFDIINCSGLLYHVFSPLNVLAGLRPLLKRNGLLVVSTNVIRDPGYFMEFNNAGRIQDENNTFWYISIPLLDYLLRYLALAPIDCCYLWHSNLSNANVRLRFDKPSGYVSVVCRAVDDVVPAGGDDWMNNSAGNSWEHRGLSDWPMAQGQPSSSVGYLRPLNREAWRNDVDTLDLWKAAQTMADISAAGVTRDSHTLRLDDID